MKNLNFLLLIAFVSGWFAACDCPEEFVLNEETVGDISDLFWVENVEWNCGAPDSSGQFIITDKLVITFNRPVDIATIRLDTTLIILPNIIESGDPLYIISPGDGRIIEIKSCVFGCGYDFPVSEVRLIENDNGFNIRSEDGQILDGDKNGEGGGNASYSVTLEDTCPDVFQVGSVVFECGSITIDSTINYFNRVKIVFNHPVDTATIFDQQNYPYIYMDPIYPMPQFTNSNLQYYSPDYRTVYLYSWFYFVPNSNIPDHFTIDIYGQGFSDTVFIPGILSSTGEKLDGDHDFNQGGFYYRWIDISPGCE